jgi:hypothetical protein
MNAALLAAYAELDALRLASLEDLATDHEIHQARRRVWKLENRLAARKHAAAERPTRAALVGKLYAYCLSRRPHLSHVA